MAYDWLLSISEFWQMEQTIRQIEKNISSTDSNGIFFYLPFQQNLKNNK
jgi:hypothetical protein